MIKVIFFLFLIIGIQAGHSQREVIVWGDVRPGHHSSLQQTLDLMKKADVKVVGIIPDVLEESSFSQALKEGWKSGGKRGIKKIKGAYQGIKEYLTTNKNNFRGVPLITKEHIPSHISIVCALLGSKEEKRFFEVMQFCKERKIRFLHPSFALMEIKFPLPLIPKVRVVAFPGSGNMLLQQFIMDHFPPYKFSVEEEFYSYLGFDCLYKCSKLFNEALGKKIIDSSPTPSDFQYNFSSANTFQGRLIITSKTNPAQNRLCFFGFPLFSFTWDVMSGSHGFPSEESIEFYNKKQYKQILIIRDPVDVIFSNIQKLSAITPEFLYPTFKLLAYYYDYYLAECIKNRKDPRLLIIKYEDMISKPHKTFKTVSDFLGLKLSDHTIKLWSQKRLFKSLPMATSKSHFRGGGMKKWKSVFPTSFFHLLENKKIIEKSKHQGYLVKKEDFQGKDSLVSAKSAWSGEPNFLSGWLPFWSVDQKHEVYVTPLGQRIYLSAHGTLKNLFNRKKLKPTGDLMFFFDACHWSKPTNPMKVPALNISQVF